MVMNLIQSENFILTQTSDQFNFGYFNVREIHFRFVRIDAVIISQVNKLKNKSICNDTKIEHSNYIFGYVCTVCSLFSAYISNLCRCHVSRQIKEILHRISFRVNGFFVFAGCCSNPITR